MQRGQTFLGIECGATHTRALLVAADGRVLRELTAGPANLRLLTDKQLIALFRSISRQAPNPGALAIGMAGARTDKDFQRIRNAAAAIWRQIPCYATNDLETALLAADAAPKAETRVLVLSGTGSCCFGVNGRSVKIGGWGHILGDKGSGYEIGLRGLKAVVYYFDRNGQWPALGARLLMALQLNEPTDLISWVQSAQKADIAALAKEAFAAWHDGDKIATDIINAAAASLVKDAIACARRLGAAGTTTQFVLAGSVLLKQPRFSTRVAKLLCQQWPGAIVTPLRRDSVWGAVELARRLVEAGPTPRPLSITEKRTEDIRALAESPTEMRNPRSMNLDKLSTRAAIQLMLREDRKIPGAILKQAREIERVIGLIVRSFRRGGRLFYVGAGTSGRLGVLDASECPPSFRTSPEMVRGIIAGGSTALWQAVEGAEDAPEAGARAVQFRGVNKKDIVIGIAASGRTPFVWGALNEGKKRGAKTVLLTFNPHYEIRRHAKPTVVIAVNVGPEILTGSTRLKAGTATKLILNMFTTVAMVRLGKVRGNLMIDLKASNSKLQDRASRIVQQLTGADYTTARAALQKADWQIKPACAALKATK